MKASTIKLLAIVLLTFLLGFPSCTSRKNDSKKIAENANDEKFQNSNVEKDADFAVDAADGAILDIKLGQLAQSNSSSAKVKQLGQTMIKDHTKAKEELKALSLKKNITLPEVLGKKNQDKYNDLAKKSGKSFDKAYTEFMVKQHKEDIDDFKKESNKGNDPELRSWASAKIPVLEHHLELAKQAEDFAKKSAR